MSEPPTVEPPTDHRWRLHEDLARRADEAAARGARDEAQELYLLAADLVEQFACAAAGRLPQHCLFAVVTASELYDRAGELDESLDVLHRFHRAPPDALSPAHRGELEPLIARHPLVMLSPVRARPPAADVPPGNLTNFDLAQLRQRARRRFPCELCGQHTRPPLVGGPPGEGACAASGKLRRARLLAMTSVGAVTLEADLLTPGSLLVTPLPDWREGAGGLVTVGGSPAFVVRAAASEAADRVYIESLASQRDALAMANTDLAVLLVSMSQVMSDLPMSLREVEADTVRAYLRGNGWTLAGRLDLAERWEQPDTEPVAFVVPEAGDYASRLWDTTLARLAMVEERSAHVILAHLLAAQFHDAMRQRHAPAVADEGAPWMH